MQRPLYIICMLLILLGSSCKREKNKTDNTLSSTIEYAKGFSIQTDHPDYRILTLNNPWDNYSESKRFYLVNDKKIETPADGTKIITPISSIMVNSATYLGFIELLDELDKVTGVCNANYIYNPTIIRGVANNKIKDLGDSFNLNQEELLLLQPELIITTAYNGDDREEELFNRIGLEALFATEWQEQSLLSRAEWIKCIGILFNKEEMADSLFTTIKTNYERAADLTKEITHRPSVLSGQDFRGTWSMPSGSSYSAELFKMAQLDYHYHNNMQFQGSIPSSIEEALVYFNEADLWLFTQEDSLSDLASANDKYNLFKAFKTGNVFNTNKRKNEVGGNDYWEMGVARPDLLLKDVIKAAHPHLLPDYELTFMDKLK